MNDNDNTYNDNNNDDDDDDEWSDEANDTDNDDNDNDLLPWVEALVHVPRPAPMEHASAVIVVTDQLRLLQHFIQDSKYSDIFFVGSAGSSMSEGQSLSVTFVLVFV